MLLAGVPHVAGAGPGGEARATNDERGPVHGTHDKPDLVVLGTLDHPPATGDRGEERRHRRKQDKGRGTCEEMAEGGPRKDQAAKHPAGDGADLPQRDRGHGIRDQEADGRDEEARLVLRGGGRKRAEWHDGRASELAEQIRAKHPQRGNVEALLEAHEYWNRAQSRSRRRPGRL